MSGNTGLNGSDRWNIVNRHELRCIKKNSWGDCLRYECRGCEEVFESNTGLLECDDPTRWVLLGAPQDGLGHCDDCDKAFPFEYQTYILEYECPNCGGQNWHRDDNTAAELISDGG